MVKTTMRFVGGTELLKAMEGLTKRVSNNILKKALIEAAEPLRKDISRRAPYEPGPPDLRENILVFPNTKILVEKSDASVAVGPSSGFPYAFYQEYGTVHHAAKPFMRPAWDAGKQRAIGDIARAMWSILSDRGITTSTRSNSNSGGGLL